MDIISYILSRKYTDNSIVGLGSIRGANCTVKDIVHQDGINTVTFEWTGTDGTTKTRDMVVYDGTPIYVWESGNTYHYGDLAIYESQFYRCIVENNDAVFDDTKWNEIGSPDGNYDIVQSKVLLPARFTAADRKLYFVIDECIFYLWDGTQWVALNHAVQVDSFPTASAKYLNKIYQYIGNTDANYTHGYFYQCVSNGATPAVYSWEYVQTSEIKIATTQEAGVVKPDGTTIDIDANGTISVINRIFTGTLAEWESLTPTQQNVYQIVNITDDEQVINLGVYLRKVQTMPLAEDCPSEFVLYVGATNANYIRGCIYQSTPSIVSGETVYNWVAQQVQADYAQNDSNAVDYIKNKPNLGTASEKDFTSNVRPNNFDLVESHAVYSAINSALSSIYVPRGELSCAELTADLLIPANIGNVYTMSDSGTTSALFINGAGHPIAVNDNVGIIRAGAESIMFNLMGNAFDLHDYQTKELETPLTIDGTEETEVEGALGAIVTGLTNAERDIDSKMSYKYNGIMGAKNLIPINYTTKEHIGITWTVNEDGHITATGSITESSETYPYSYIELSSRAVGTDQRLTLKEGSYTITFDGTNLDGFTYVSCRYINIDGTGGVDLISSLNITRKSATFTITSEQAATMDLKRACIMIRLYISFNKSLHPLPYIIENPRECYVMLRHAEDTDDTWQPYAMTNRDLTTSIIHNVKDGSGTSALTFNNTDSNTASGQASSAFGYNNQATGLNSFTSGSGSIASGSGAHAQGFHVQATGNHSSARGHYTISQGKDQTAIGSCNVAQGTQNSWVGTDQAFIIGNGTSENNRSNALAVQWDGTVVFQDGSTQKTSALEKVSALPTASVDYLGKAYLLTSAQAGYIKGGIYQCISDGEATPTYSWQLISASDKDKVSYEYQGKVGAKNLLIYPYYINSRTTHGITWDSTITNDGRVVVNGQADGYSNYEMYYDGTSNSIDLKLKAGDYIASIGGCDNNENIMFRIRLVYPDPETGTTVTKANVTRQTNYKLEFNISDQEADDLANGIAHFEGRVYYPAASTEVFNNLIISPMLRYAEDSSDTWQPYAKTNKELTDGLSNLISTLNVTNISEKKIDITAFGGKAGVNSSDNSQLLISAITYAMANDYTLYVPQGIYYIKSGVEITNDLKIEGATTYGQAGQEVGSVIRFSPLANDVTLFYDNGSHNVSLRNIQFFCGYTHFTRSFEEVAESPHAYLTWSYDYTDVNCLNIPNSLIDIYNVGISGFSGYAIQCKSNRIITNVKIGACKYGFYECGTDVVFHDCYVSQCEYAFYWVTNGTVIFSYDTWIDLCGYGYYSEKELSGEISGLIDHCLYAGIRAKHTQSGLNFNGRMGRCGMYYTGTDMLEFLSGAFTEEKFIEATKGVFVAIRDAKGLNLNINVYPRALDDQNLGENKLPTLICYGQKFESAIIKTSHNYGNHTYLVANTADSHVNVINCDGSDTMVEFTAQELQAMW